MMLSLLGGWEMMARRGAANMSQEVGGWAFCGRFGGRVTGIDGWEVVPGLKVRSGVEIRKAIQRSVTGNGTPFE